MYHARTGIHARFSACHVRAWCVGLCVLPLLGCKLVSQYQPNPISTYRGRHYFEQGLAESQEGNLLKAEESLARAVRLCEDNPEMRREYARVLSEQGKVEASIAELEQAVRLDRGSNAALFVAIAEKRLLLNQTDHAFQAVQRAIDLDPRAAEAWRVRGDVYRRFNLPEEALADYHRALALSPQDCNLPVRIAETYLVLKQPDRALVALQRLGNRWPRDEEPQRILLLKGVAQMNLGRYADAVEYFTAAAERESASADLYYRLAEAEAYAGRPERATEAARAALQLDPAHQASRDLLHRVGQQPLAHTAAWP